DAPRYQGHGTPAEIQSQISVAAAQFKAVAKDFSASDYGLLTEFLQQNSHADITQLETWLSAWSYICDCLEPEHVTAAPAPAHRVTEPEPVVEQTILERKQGERNDDYDRRCMIANAIDELQPQFASAAESITVDETYLSEAQRKQLFRRFAQTRSPLTKEVLRSLAIEIWGG